MFNSLQGCLGFGVCGIHPFWRPLADRTSSCLFAFVRSCESELISIMNLDHPGHSLKLWFAYWLAKEKQLFGVLTWLVRFDFWRCFAFSSTLCWQSGYSCLKVASRKTLRRWLPNAWLKVCEHSLLILRGSACSWLKRNFDEVSSRIIVFLRWGLEMR